MQAEVIEVRVMCCVSCVVCVLVIILNKQPKKKQSGYV